MKRVVVVSDLHCGHKVGLTPPIWQTHKDVDPVAAYVQRECWDHFKEIISAIKPVDVLICNGDAIDGKGKKSGGVEQITTDMDEQSRMAVYAIKEANAREHHFIYGTDYHAAIDGQDFEARIAHEFSAPIEAHSWLEIEGVKFNLKHHMGSSALPHTRMTGLGREAIQDMLWQDLDGSPGTDVLIRSHVHYHVDAGGFDFPRMLTTPALQGPGSRYGVRRCSGTVHFGLVYFDCENGGFEWKAIGKRIRAGAPKLRKL